MLKNVYRILQGTQRCFSTSSVLPVLGDKLEMLACQKMLHIHQTPSYKIETLTPNHREAVFEFLMTQFIPDEPLFIATEAYSGDGLAEKILQGDVRERFTKRPLEAGDSLGAFDDNGNLLGIRLGFISDKQSLPWEANHLYQWMLRMPPFLFPTKIWKMLQVIKFIEDLGYSYINGFDQCVDNNGKIYFCLALGVGREGRGLGLGSQMFRQSIEHAKEQGCSHMYVLATGKVSQRIVQNHGFYLINEKDYESYKDKQGQVIIKHDTHTSAQVVALKFIE